MINDKSNVSTWTVSTVGESEGVMQQPEIGRVGVFVGRSRFEGADGRGFAEMLDGLGYRTLWLADVDENLAVVEEALSCSEKLAVGSAVLSIWLASADTIADRFAGLERWFPGRALAGFGVSHAPLVERVGRTYRKPYAMLAGYLEELAGAGHAMNRSLVGANGPKMLALAGARTAGAVPYLTTAEQTAEARGHLGPDPLLCPVQKVVLDTDVSAARELARKEIAVYLGLPNYVRNLRRMGFTDGDLADGGSDRLVDSLVACGDADTILRRVNEQLAAGADHVAVHALCADGLPTESVRRLAPVLA